MYRASQTTLLKKKSQQKALKRAQVDFKFNGCLLFEKKKEIWMTPIVIYLKHFSALIVKVKTLKSVL